MERDIKFCHPILQDVWKEACERYKQIYPNAPQPFLTCTFRSNEEQSKLYARGRTKPGKIVTNIQRNGKHNRMPAEAFDVAFKKDGRLDWSGVLFRNFAAIVKQIDSRVEWGGDWKSFKDLPHFEI